MHRVRGWLVRCFANLGMAALLVLGNSAIASAQTVTIVEKVPSEIVLGCDMANLVSVTGHPQKLATPEIQTAIDNVFALFAKRLPMAAAHGPEAMRARALLRPQATYDDAWQKNAQDALAAWQKAMMDTWHPKTPVHIAAFYLGEDTQTVSNNALSTKSPEIDATFRGELAQITQLDITWFRLKGARLALLAAKPQDWDTIAKRSAAMLSILEDPDDLYTPAGEKDP